MVTAVEKTPPLKSIRVQVEAGENGPDMAFIGAGRGDVFSVPSLSSLKGSDILKLLDAHLVLQPEKGELRVFLPKEKI